LRVERLRGRGEWFFGCETAKKKAKSKAAPLKPKGAALRSYHAAKGLPPKVTLKVVDPSELGSRFKEAVVGVAKDSIIANIEAVHCPVHNQNAKAVLKETADGGLNYEIRGCCHALIEEVKRFLGARVSAE
jgi:hypothetical protein